MRSSFFGVCLLFILLLAHTSSEPLEILKDPVLLEGFHPSFIFLSIAVFILILISYQLQFHPYLTFLSTAVFIVSPRNTLSLPTITEKV